MPGPHFPPSPQAKLKQSQNTQAPRMRFHGSAYGQRTVQRRLERGVGGSEGLPQR